MLCDYSITVTFRPVEEEEPSETMGGEGEVLDGTAVPLEESDVDED